MAFNTVEKIDDLIKINNVLISVSDKSGLEILVPALVRLNNNIRIYSTGHTYSRIKDILGENYADYLSSVTDYTGQPEMQGGLVKTLDFKIYLGLLSETYNPDHQDDIRRVDGVEFDMVVVNLYPFVKTVQDPGISPENARANIDIGGPCMLRASAKNYIRVASVCSPARYRSIVSELEKNDCSMSLKTRFDLAKQTFHHTAVYDAHIDKYLSGKDFSEITKTYNIH